MKNFIIQYYRLFLVTLLFTFFSKSSLVAQCGFVNSIDCEPVFEDYTGIDVTLNLVFHIIRRNDGTGGATSSDLAFYLDELADAYTSSEIYFDTLCTNYIDSSALYNDCSLMGDHWEDFKAAFGSGDAVNVFIHPGGQGSGCIFGSGDIGGNSCYIQNRAHRNLASHEIGHVLNLLHTFEPCGGNHSCLGDSMSLIYDGDLCADTPPDEWEFNPYLDTLNCTWDTAACMAAGSNCSDYCGTYPYPSFDFGIMMSYYHRCTQYFTHDQQNRMKHKIVNNLNNTYFTINRVDSIISDSVTVSSAWRPAKNIIIENGGVLIVTSTIYMPDKAKIIIESGGILSVNGGTITRGGFKDLCHERTGNPKFWYGIEMQLSTSSPFPKFSCVNGTIEYSEKGVHNPPSKTAGNGTIAIYNSVFKNNLASIFIERAPSFSSPISVKRTRFYLDDTLTLSNYYTQIHIDNSKIYLDSCIFDNPIYIRPVSDSAYAIRTFNTDIGIQHSIFKDSIYGVQCLSKMSKATVGITLTKFTKTRIGVNTTDGINNYSITKDTFDTSIRFGLLSDRCSGYIINNNRFTGPNPPTDSAGIQMNNSGEYFNLIQQNIYNSIKHGNVVNGINGNPNIGLQFLCNSYSNFTLHENVLNGWVSLKQGEPLKGTGNTAADNQVDHDIKFGMNTDNMTYYYKDSISTHIPDSDPKYRMLKTKTNFYNCSKLTGKPDTISHYVLYKRLEDTLDNRSNKYQDSIDGGNTSALISHISGANSGTATFLYNQLINLSPWLSTSVALASYNRSDIFDSTKRAQILYNNPDLFRIRTYREALADADSPLPQSALDALDTLTLYTTIRTDLEAEISSLDLEKSSVCYDILHELKINTLDQTDSILVWLERADDYASRREIMETHLGNGDYTEASSALSDLGELENLNESQISDLEGLEDLLSFIIDVREDGRYEGNLTEEEIEWMIDFAENNDNQAGHEVRSALYFYYNINVDDVEPLRGYIDHKKAKVGENVIPIKKETLSDKINIYPNPCNHELIIELPSSPHKETWDIELMDIDGKQLMLSKANSGTIRIDINKIPTGIFLVKLSSSHGERITKRVQVIK